MFPQDIAQSTLKVREALELAVTELARLQQNALTPDLVLLGLLTQTDTEAVEILAQLLPDYAAARRTLRERIHDTHEVISTRPSSVVVATDELSEVFRIAHEEAGDLGDEYIGTGSLLVALADERSGNCAALLREVGLTAERLRESLKALRQGRILDEPDAEGRLDVLSHYTTDLTAMARRGELDPVIGREEEIERIIQTLSRRKKNNPVLIGESGVGKTVIVEGLAQQIVDAEVPDWLLDRQVLALDMGEIVAGAKMRGEFEERLKSVRDAVIDAKGRAILFIDELPTVVAAGAGGGGLDAPSMLKPALARGSLQVIGADTLDEYREHVEADKALERRFQPILVREPAVDETVAILEGLAPRYERHHRVRYLPDALTAAAQLSERYIADRHLPDKAVDLIDEAGSRKHLKLESIPPRVRELEMRRQRLLRSKGDAFDAEDFEKVAKLQMSILDLEQQLEKARADWQRDIADEDAAVDAEDIAEVVARWTGIPIARMVETEAEKLARMEDELHLRIVGQDEAVRAVSDAIRRNRAGVTQSSRPIASFLFLGPTGVGKTELARALAAFLLDDESRIVRLDMSEYMERHEVSKMIGAPPGYIGYGEGGQLTERVRRNPYAVVLLDEIEKAHPDVFNMLLQILEDGRLTDAQGRTVSFRNTILIGTSNLGTESLSPEKRPIGFVHSATLAYEEARTMVLGEVRKFFKPEFLNRLDDLIVFHYLEMEHVRRIAAMFIEDLRARMGDRQIALLVDEAVTEKLAHDGFDPVYGARPLRREVERQIENPLAMRIVTGEFRERDTVEVSLDDGRIVLRSARPEAPGAEVASGETCTPAGPGGHLPG